ncbi:MAG: hypothetical protein NC828_04340 [Candidatus Omnitrophica bacterium]|nr:hypothetical protein [Candidatus Omnitrophota bacterium]
MDKPKEQFRILALGESTVFGVGINYGQRFTEIIEQLLSNVEVVNMAISGFGMDQSYLQLKREGFQYKPDLVILFSILDYPERCKDYYFWHRFKPRFVVNKNKLELQNLDFVKKEFGSKIEEDLKDITCASKKTEKAKTNLNMGINRLLEKSNLYLLCNLEKKINKIDERRIEKDKEKWAEAWVDLNITKKARYKYENEYFEN